MGFKTRSWSCARAAHALETGVRALRVRRGIHFSSGTQRKKAADARISWLFRLSVVLSIHHVPYTHVTDIISYHPHGQQMKGFSTSGSGAS